MSYGPAPESAKAAEEYLAEHKRQFQLFINGDWQKSSSKKMMDSINPATKKKLAKISVASKADVNSAVAAAKQALLSLIHI